MNRMNAEYRGDKAGWTQVVLEVQATVSATRKGWLVALLGDGTQVGYYDEAKDVGEMFPCAGLPATLAVGSDRHAYTITRASTIANIVWARADKAVRTDKNGMSESQAYTYERDPSAPEEQFRLGKRGLRSKRGTLHLGHRRAYHDFSF